MRFLVFISLPFLLSACAEKVETLHTSEKVVQTRVEERLIYEKTERIAVHVNAELPEIPHSFDFEETTKPVVPRVMLRATETRRGNLFQIETSVIEATDYRASPGKAANAVFAHALTLGLALFTEKGRSALVGDPTTLTRSLEREGLVKKLDEMAEETVPIAYEKIIINHAGEQVFQAFTDSEGRADISFADIIPQNLRSTDKKARLYVTIPNVNWEQKITIELKHEHLAYAKALQSSIEEFKHVQDLRREKEMEQIRKKELEAEIRRARESEEEFKRLTLNLVGLGDIESLLTRCESLGFKRGTKDIGECVLRLSS